MTIDVDKLCVDLMERWDIADKQKEELIRQVMADIVTPIVVSQPTVEPERKKGKWIKHERGYWTFVNKDGERDGWIPDYECSECGSRGWKYADNTMNFCPNCGSDMREDQDESKAETNGCIPGDCGESS